MSCNVFGHTNTDIVQILEPTIQNPKNSLGIENSNLRRNASVRHNPTVITSIAANCIVLFLILNLRFTVNKPNLINYN